jgi:hypothetical protein
MLFRHFSLFTVYKALKDITLNLLLLRSPVFANIYSDALLSFCSNIDLLRFKLIEQG